MSDFEPIYINLEEYNAFKENSQDSFIDEDELENAFKITLENAFENTRCLIGNDYDDNLGYEEIEDSNDKDNKSSKDDNENIIDKNEISTTKILGVCFIHFTFDQNRLHSDCYKEHSWKINGNNVQVPCIGVAKCLAFTEGTIVQKSSLGNRIHYICTKCFQKQSEHLYKRPDKPKPFVQCTELEKYRNNTNNVLADIGR
ncbi:hypothetical protein C2G38_2204944 [Gigaspora rosea]|uniref:Uncharacterized protein n=1 Tax=Gigaspora rosea TaxID=44941 RepID=A0A397UKU5_9GLOM|nr:hypothetical protein C2G38_2204944 [Gigaspora rosea]